MKINRIVFPLMLALIATMAATGCNKKAPKVTPLPGQVAPIVDNQNASTLPPGQTTDSSSGVGKAPGNLATTGLDEFEGMIKDKGALAAYTIHYKFDSAVVMKDDHSKLEAVAAALKSSPSDKLLIEGNCDERGTQEYNRALGERRALAAREALAKLGVNPNRVRTLSNGQDQPVDNGHNEAAWRANRRADFILLHPKPGTM